MKTKMSFLVAVAVIGLSARGAEFYADFGEVVGKVRPELHGSGMGGQLVGGISGREPELLGPLGLWGRGRTTGRSSTPGSASATRTSSFR